MKTVVQYLRFYSNYHVTKNISEVPIDGFKQLLGQSSGEPEYFLALRYLDDKDPNTRKKEAFRLLNIASQAGCSLALWEIGRSYENCVGVDKNYLFALGWYRKHQSLIDLNSSDPRYYLQTSDDIVEQPYQNIFE